jgi:hypothetical protein
VKETDAMLRFLGRSVLVAALLATTGLVGLAQKTDKSDKLKAKDGSLACRDDRRWYNDRLVGTCEIREQTLAPSGAPAAFL